MKGAPGAWRIRNDLPLLTAVDAASCGLQRLGERGGLRKLLDLGNLRVVPEAPRGDGLKLSNTAPRVVAGTIIAPFDTKKYTIQKWRRKKKEGYVAIPTRGRKDVLVYKIGAGGTAEKSNDNVFEAMNNATIEIFDDDRAAITATKDISAGDFIHTGYGAEAWTGIPNMTQQQFEALYNGWIHDFHKHHTAPHLLGIEFKEWIEREMRFKIEIRARGKCAFPKCKLSSGAGCVMPVHPLLSDASDAPIAYCARHCPGRYNASVSCAVHYRTDGGNPLSARQILQRRGTVLGVAESGVDSDARGATPGHGQRLGVLRPAADRGAGSSHAAADAAAAGAGGAAGGTAHQSLATAVADVPPAGTPSPPVTAVPVPVRLSAELRMQLDALGVATTNNAILAAEARETRRAVTELRSQVGELESRIAVVTAEAAAAAEKLAEREKAFAARALLVAGLRRRITALEAELVAERAKSAAFMDVIRTLRPST